MLRDQGAVVVLLDALDAWAHAPTDARDVLVHVKIIVLHAHLIVHQDALVRALVDVKIPVIRHVHRVVPVVAHIQLVLNVVLDAHPVLMCAITVAAHVQLIVHLVVQRRVQLVVRQHVIQRAVQHALHNVRQKVPDVRDVPLHALEDARIHAIVALLRVMDFALEVAVMHVWVNAPDAVNHAPVNAAVALEVAVWSVLYFAVLAA